MSAININEPPIDLSFKATLIFEYLLLAVVVQEDMVTLTKVVEAVVLEIPNWNSKFNSGTTYTITVGAAGTE